MKNVIIHLLALISLVLLLAGCTPENTSPRQSGSSPSFAQFAEISGGEHSTPPDACGGLDTILLKDDAGSVRSLRYAENYGLIQMGNTSDTLFFLLNTGRNWFFTELGCWYGEIGNCPMSGGTINISNFPLQQNFGVAAVGHAYIVIDLNSLPKLCASYIIQGKVARMSGFFGGIDQGSVTHFWVPGTSHGNGQYFDFCAVDCEDPLAQSCQVGPDKYRTHTIEGWGSRAMGGNPGTYRNAHFAQAFPNGLSVGCAGGFTLRLTSSGAVENLLPSPGSPAALTRSLVNPTRNIVRNILASQLIAATLSTTFDTADEGFGSSDLDLAELTITTGLFSGQTVRQVIDEANLIFGGCSQNHSPSVMNEVLTRINENFLDGTHDGGFLACPSR